MSESMNTDDELDDDVFIRPSITISDGGMRTSTPSVSPDESTSSLPQIESRRQLHGSKSTSVIPEPIMASEVLTQPRRKSFFVPDVVQRMASTGSVQLPNFATELINELHSLRVMAEALEDGVPCPPKTGNRIRAGIDRCVEDIEDHFAGSDNDPHNLIKRSLTNKLNESMFGNAEDREVAEWIQQTYAADYLKDDDLTSTQSMLNIYHNDNSPLSAADELVVEKFLGKFDSLRTASGSSETDVDSTPSRRQYRRESAPRLTILSKSSTTRRRGIHTRLERSSTVGEDPASSHGPEALELDVVLEAGNGVNNNTKQVRKKAPKWLNAKANKNTFMRAQSAHSSAVTREHSTQKLSTPVFSVECDNLMTDLTQWDLDVFKLDEYSGGRPLTAVGIRIFEHLGFISEFKISPLRLCKFFMAVEDGYHRYPEVQYHNNLHAADVLYSTFRLLQSEKLAGSITRLEMFAAIVAATVHDVHHPGRTNQFLADTQHEYAILYNDRAVLENHHCAWTFSLLMKKDCNLLASFSKEQSLTIRKMVTSMVLSTDMAEHFKHLGDFRAVVERKPDNEGSLDGFSSTATKVVISAILHLADLGASTKSWDLCQKWAHRVMNEFFNQGDQEKTLGLPVGPLNERSTFIPKSQTGFLDFVAIPLWETWDDYVGGGTIQFKNLCENRDRWEKLVVTHDAEIAVNIVPLPQHVGGKNRRITPLGSSESREPGTQELEVKTFRETPLQRASNSQPPGEVNPQRRRRPSRSTFL